MRSMVKYCVLGISVFVCAAVLLFLFAKPVFADDDTVPGPPAEPIPLPMVRISRNSLSSFNMEIRDQKYGAVNLKQPTVSMHLHRN